MSSLPSYGLYTGYGLVLFDSVGRPTLAETGPFGAIGRSSTSAADTLAYEMMIPVGTVPGRKAGTTLSAELARASTAFDLVSAVSGASLDVMERFGSLPPPEWPPGYQIVESQLVEYSLGDDGSLTLGLTFVTRDGVPFTVVRRLFGAKARS